MTNPIQIILDGILQRHVDFDYQPHFRTGLLNKNKIPLQKRAQIKRLNKVIRSGDVLTIKRKSTLAKAIIAYSRTPYGKPLVNSWLMLKAMVRKPHTKPQIMPVMLFANGIFKDRLAPANFFMWMLTEYNLH